MIALFHMHYNWVWLLWNDGPGGVEAALVLLDVEFPVAIKIP